METPAYFAPNYLQITLGSDAQERFKLMRLCKEHGRSEEFYVIKPNEQEKKMKKADKQKQARQQSKTNSLSPQKRLRQTSASRIK